jgi:hypothetical protein
MSTLLDDERLGATGLGVSQKHHDTQDTTSTKQDAALAFESGISFLWY